MMIRLLKLDFNRGTQTYQCLRHTPDGFETIYRVPKGALIQPDKNGQMWFVDAVRCLEGGNEHRRIVEISCLQRVDLNALSFKMGKNPAGEGQWELEKGLTPILLVDADGLEEGWVKLMIVVDKFDTNQPTSVEQIFDCEAGRLVGEDWESGYFVLAVHLTRQVGLHKRLVKSSPILVQKLELVNSDLPNRHDLEVAEAEARRLLEEERIATAELVIIKAASHRVGKGAGKASAKGNKPVKRNHELAFG